MKQAACLAFLLIFCKHCFCQNPYNIDSLLKVLPTQGEDSLKVRTLVRITNHYMLSDLPKAMEYSKQVYDLSNKIKWKKGCVLSYALTGSAYYYQGNFPQALIYRQKELKGWQEMGYKPQACMTLGNLATLYSDLGDNVKALEQYFITLQLANDTKDTETTTSTLCNIGVLYKDMGDTVKALNYLNRALKLSEIYGYRHLSSLNLINIGSIYSDRCQFSVALDYYSKALKIDEEQGNRQTLPGLLTNIAGIYQLQSDLAKKAGNTTLMNEKAKEAWHIFNKALNEARATDNLFIEASVLGDLAAINTSNKNFGEAEKDLKQSHALADSIGAVDLLISNHQRFYELYKGMKRYPEAFEHNERYMALKDSIYGLQNKNAISELQVKYDTEKKEAENNALAQKNKILELSVTNNRYLTFSLVTLCLLIIGIGYLVVRQNKLRSKQENARLEQKLLRTQMNPHFIFNRLANIESFIYEHQPKEAGDYLARFARLMRLILENSSSE